MANENENGEEVASNKYLGWRIFTGGLVVVIALGALVGSLAVVLDAYETHEASAAPVTSATTTAVPASAPDGSSGKTSKDETSGGSSEPEGGATSAPAETSTAPTTPSDVASVSASSVVAILTPLAAAIVGIAGLFFGISATGSNRGRETEALRALAEKGSGSDE